MRRTDAVYALIPLPKAAFAPTRSAAECFGLVAEFINERRPAGFVWVATLILEFEVGVRIATQLVCRATSERSILGFFGVDRFRKAGISAATAITTLRHTALGCLIRAALPAPPPVLDLVAVLGGRLRSSCQAEQSSAEQNAL